MARRSMILVSRTLYQIGVVTLIVAAIWLGMGIYTTLNKPTNVEVEKKILDPINPVLDVEVINKLSQRLVVEPAPVNASESGSIDTQGIQP